VVAINRYDVRCRLLSAGIAADRCCWCMRSNNRCDLVCISSICSISSLGVGTAMRHGALCTSIVKTSQQNGPLLCHYKQLCQSVRLVVDRLTTCWPVVRGVGGRWEGWACTPPPIVHWLQDVCRSVKRTAFVMASEWSGWAGIAYGMHAKIGVEIIYRRRR